MESKCIYLLKIQEGFQTDASQMALSANQISAQTAPANYSDIKVSIWNLVSEMVAEVFCGLVQITTNVGFAVTMDKESFHFWHMWDPQTGDGPYVCRLTIKRMDKLNVRHQIILKKIHQFMSQNHGLEKNRTVMTATVKNRPIVLTRNGVCTG